MESWGKKSEQFGRKWQISLSSAGTFIASVTQQFRASLTSSRGESKGSIGIFSFLEFSILLPFELASFSASSLQSRQTASSGYVVFIGNTPMRKVFSLLHHGHQTLKNNWLVSLAHVPIWGPITVLRVLGFACVSAGREPFRQDPKAGPTKGVAAKKETLGRLQMELKKSITHALYDMGRKMFRILVIWSHWVTWVPLSLLPAVRHWAHYIMSLSLSFSSEVIVRSVNFLLYKNMF